MMNFNKTALMIGLILAISLAGCDLAWQRYSNKEYGFSILFPRMWYKEQGALGTVILATAPSLGADDKYRENATVTVVDLPEDISLEIFVDINREETMRVLPGEESDISDGEISAGGRRGRWFAFTNHMQEGLTLRIISAAWKKGNRIYAVTCSGELAEYPKYEPTFNKILRSLRIK